MRSAFTGAFAPYICGLIEKKQALGYDYHGSACILRTFDEFCREQFPNETCLTAELAMKWAEQFKTEKNLSRLNRVFRVVSVAQNCFHHHIASPYFPSKFKIASPYLARSRAQTIRWNASSVTNSGDARSARVILGLPVEMALAA